MAFKFENLVVWQKAIDLSASVYNLTRTFPTEERFVLSSQIQRAADSVSLNIAEGSTGQTIPEFKRFLSIALRSNIEVVGCLWLAKKRKIISDHDFGKIYKACEEILVMVNSLKNALK